MKIIKINYFKIKISYRSLSRMERANSIALLLLPENIRTIKRIRKIELLSSTHKSRT